MGSSKPAIPVIQHIQILHSDSFLTLDRITGLARLMRFHYIWFRNSRKNCGNHISLRLILSITFCDFKIKFAYILKESLFMNKIKKCTLNN